MKKIIFAVLAVALAVAMLSACSSSEGAKTRSSAVETLPLEDK